MHRVLDIPELVVHICTFADDATLAHLARCCSSIHDPVIRVLWSELPGMAPVVKCFPEALWVEHNGKSSLVGTPLPRDWLRVYHHSQHVRVLGMAHSMDSLCSGMVDSQALRTISALKPSLLFPKLHSIVRCPCMESMEPECIPALLSLCGPHLRKVDLGTLQYLPDFLTSTLSSIFDRFLHLQSFSISFIVEGRPLTEERSARKLMLPSFAAHQLTRFSCLNIPLEDESFNLISRLPRLGYLCCEVSSTADLSSFARGPVPFPALKQLDVKIAVGRYIDFSKVYLPGVHDAELTFTEVGDADQLPVAISHIPKQFSASALRHLKLLAFRRRGGQAGRVVVLPSHLRPLLDFRDLTSLRLQLACDLRLDDQVCADMAHAWCHMRYLAIITFLKVLDLPTLEGLIPFAIHCTQLVHLSLYVVARDFNEATMALPRRLERSPLTFLYVGDSPISRPHRVAAFLSQMFPRLRRISHSKSWEDTPEAETQDRDWNEVQRYISLFAEIREDERRWVELERDKEDKPSGLVRGDSQ
ncbi:hypothetical protein K466DRAFT_381408 [Polyporus arcularius HHB13444]|uniref:F-box domain-containing protein n=1 Tax=Polyporus arcularius HHB13444 TaxID=1314778 RepID=A0A5C3PLV0_9APHY|nr:hypothetical protein K466DRAFT_381408 [Polyporus arcularius HHB13444]